MKHAMRLLAAILTVLALCAASAGAHVQVRPSQAAPEDPVLFEVLVPNEDDKPTVEVEVAVPPGVIPFSFEEVPGWKRRLTQKPNGATRSIVWTGSLPPEAFARFTFLASTPSKEGTIAWKALQTYAGNEIVRWIGPPDSGHPAATTRISADVPRQNAGGEGARGGAAEQPDSEPATPAGGEEPESGDASNESGSDGLARALGAAGLVAGLLALGLSLIRRRERSST